AERLFEHYFTGQLWLVPLTGEPRPLGDAGIVSAFDPAPGGELILVERIRRPFSYLVPYHRFAADVRLMDTAGATVRMVAEMPLAEEVPVVFDAVVAGPRGFHWRSDVPAELVWVEALDGGDPRVPAEARDRVLTLGDPAGEPRPLIDLEHRYAGIHWGRGDLALVYSRWWVTRTERRFAVQPDSPESPRLMVERSYQDAYHDPGWPVTTRTREGRSVLLFGDGNDSIYL